VYKRAAVCNQIQKDFVTAHRAANCVLIVVSMCSSVFPKLNTDVGWRRNIWFCGNSNCVGQCLHRANPGFLRLQISLAQLDYGLGPTICSLERCRCSHPRPSNQSSDSCSASNNCAVLYCQCTVPNHITHGVAPIIFLQTWQLVLDMVVLHIICCLFYCMIASCFQSHGRHHFGQCFFLLMLS
jgi:hypothetical protein